MSKSLSEWLALREAADHAARSEALTRKVAEAVAAAHPVRVVDLGAGRGSNRRYLRRFLPADQEWLLVDRDAALLSDAAAGPGIETCAVDLGRLDCPEIFDGRQLVTASALLDLVSEPWLHALAAECRRVHAIALFALSYDGRSQCTPLDPDDLLIRELMNMHQRRNDKGFGRSAGPDAVDAAEAAFRAVGYRVERERSDWNLSPDSQDLQRELVEGWATAAIEIAPAEAARIAAWQARRHAHIAAARSSITVGHQDLAAWPVSDTEIP